MNLQTIKTWPKLCASILKRFVMRIFNIKYPKLTRKDVEWVVNDNAELGIKTGSQFFFLYKGSSLVYEDAKHDNGDPMHWRPVFKREFGECCYPVDYQDPTKIGTVSLADYDKWAELPPNSDA